MAVKDADCPRLTGRTIVFRTNLVIDIGAETIEVISSVLLSDVRTDLKRFCVLQEHNRPGHRGSTAIQNSAFD